MIERYLLRFRIALGNAPQVEKDELVAEIRSHILDRLASDPEAAILADLGPPEKLAAAYLAEGLLKRAAWSVSPILIMRATLHWAMTGVRGFLVFLVLLVGYVTGAGFYICAIAKPFFPEYVGLWTGPHRFSFGLIVPPETATGEILGIWFAPVALVLGSLCLIGVTHFVRWMIRNYGGVGRAIAQPMLY